MTMPTSRGLDRIRDQLLLDLNQFLRRHLGRNIDAKIALRVLLRRLHLAQLFLVLVENRPLVGNRYVRRDHDRKPDRHQLPQDPG